MDQKKGELLLMELWQAGLQYVRIFHVQILLEEMNNQVAAVINCTKRESFSSLARVDVNGGLILDERNNILCSGPIA